VPVPVTHPRIPRRGSATKDRTGSGGTGTSIAAGILTAGEVAERLMAALLKSAESKDFVGSNPTLSATDLEPIAVRCVRALGRSTVGGQDHRLVGIVLFALQTRRIVLQEV
jgi:hypothetical protein